MDIIVRVTDGIKYPKWSGCNMNIAGKDRCINCMGLRNDVGVCPFCGYNENNYKASVTGLPAGTCLHDRYFVGRVLGKGGFGITYSAWDIVLAIPVAVKEYYPEGQAGRNKNDNTSLFVFEGEDDFDKGLREFLHEARVLSKFIKYDGIVSVRDFFRENNTAYIVMEYVKGIPLNRYMDMKGSFSPADVLEKMKPIIRSLGKIHNTGYLHRDISPGNLLYTYCGEIVLIDFGAAKVADGTNSTITVAVKRGYSPEEQYRTRGELGPWTDIYSLCAVMYYMITGIVPTESVERLLSDDVRPLAGMNGIDLSVDIKKAIDKGMAVYRNDRFNSIEELYKVLYRSDDTENIQDDPAWKQYNNEESGDSDAIKSESRDKVSKTMLRREIENLLNKEKRKRLRKRAVIAAMLICSLILCIGITKIFRTGITDEPALAQKAEPEATDIPAAEPEVTKAPAAQKEEQKATDTPMAEPETTKAPAAQKEEPEATDTPAEEPETTKAPVRKPKKTETNKLQPTDRPKKDNSVGTLD